MANWDWNSSKVRGFTIVELAIGMGLTAIMALGVATTANAYFHSMNHIRLSTVKMEILRNIRAAAHEPAALINSMALEPSLVPCLSFSLGGAPCVSKDSGGAIMVVPFTLTSSISSTDILAGPAGPIGSHNPVYYDRDGKRCADGAGTPDQCPLQAISTFSVHCQSGADSCQGAEALTIQFTVKKRDDMTIDEPALRTVTGVVTKNLRDGKYVQVPSVSAMGSGLTVTEIDMAQGKLLSVGPLEEARAQILLRDSVAIDSLEVRVWNLPTGCDFSNINTTGCERPPLENYALKSSTPISLAAWASGKFSLSFIPGNTGFSEVVILSKSGPEYRVRSNTLLRMKVPVLPVVSVSGPNPLRKDCDDPKSAKFIFQAQDSAGIASYSITVSPPLPDGTTTLPGFAFNKSDTGPQPFELAYEVFQPGVTYNISFSVINNEGLSQSASHSMPVAVVPNPAQKVTFNTPNNTSFLRATDNLTVDATVQLACEQSVNRFEISTAKSGGLQWMANKEISCSKIDGPTDVRTYQCQTSLDCKTWLNLPNCSDYAEPDGTLVKLTGVVSPNSGPGATGSTEFQVGQKISVSLNPPDVQHYIVPGQFTGLSLSMKVKFAAAPSMPTDLKLAYSTGQSLIFTCPAGAILCPIPNAPVPASNSVITLSTTAGSDPETRVVEPYVAQVNYITMFSSCSTQTYPPACIAPQVAKASFSQVAIHDGAFGATNFFLSIPLHPGANLDFVAVHRQAVAFGAQSKASLSFTIRHYDGDGTLLATTTTSPITEASDVPAKAFYVSDEYWKLHSGQNYAASNVEVKATSTDYETVIVRQCYCE